MFKDEKKSISKLPKQEYLILFILVISLINLVLSLSAGGGMNVLVSEQAEIDHKLLKASICLSGVKSIQRKEIDPKYFTDDIINFFTNNNYKNIDSTSSHTPYVNIEGVSICRVVLDSQDDKRYLTFEMQSDPSYPFIYKIVSIKETSEGGI